MLTEDGRKIIDFLSGAGTLNYGDNNHQIRAVITEHFASDAVIHGLYMATPAKLEFMKTFSSAILQERNLQYRFQFTGPQVLRLLRQGLSSHAKSQGARMSSHSRMDIMA